MDDGFSYPYGLPMVMYPILAIGVAQGGWWAVISTVAAVLAALAFTWEALSPGDFEKIRQEDATLTRGSWRANWLLFFALPGYVVAAVALVRNYG